MRIGMVKPLLAVALVLGSTQHALAQGADEEVRRAVERAISSSISSSVTESLSRSIMSEGLEIMPTTTLFASPFYSRVEVDFLGADANADAGGAVLGVLHKVHDIVLVHAAIAGTGTSTEVEFEDENGDDETTDASGGAINTTLGADIVYLNQTQVKAWLTTEAGFSYLDTDVSDGSWGWLVSPSTTVSVRTGPVLIEPNLGFQFIGSFDDGGGVAYGMVVGTSVKYRGDRWRPQFNFAYSKLLDASEDDGFISFGPEVLYAVTPAILVGGAYSYGTSLTDGLDVDAHTITAEFRWTF